MEYFGLRYLLKQLDVCFSLFAMPQIKACVVFSRRLYTCGSQLQRMYAIWCIIYTAKVLAKIVRSSGLYVGRGDHAGGYFKACVVFSHRLCTCGSQLL